MQYFGFGFILFWIVCVVGWIGNVVQIVARIHDEITVLMILKIVGIFVPPLGSIMGWVGFF
jgi:hypothetical protein